MEFSLDDVGFVCPDSELYQEDFTLLPIEDVFGQYDAFESAAFRSVESSSEDILSASDLTNSSNWSTPSASDALRCSRASTSSVPAIMVEQGGPWPSSASTSSGSKQDDPMTDGEACDRPEATVSVMSSAPRGVSKVRGRRTNRQRTDPALVVQAVCEQATAAAAAAAFAAQQTPPALISVDPSPLAAVQAAVAAATGCTEQQLESQSMSGVLRPFDAVKDYSGRMTLQQLNARIRGSCMLL